LAKANNTPVPAMPLELVPDTTSQTATMDGPEVAELESAPLMAEKPDGQEVNLAYVFLMTDPQARAQLPPTLPTTASKVPISAVISLLSLVIAGALRVSAALAK
jgi:hypothetical protein